MVCRFRNVLLPAATITPSLASAHCELVHTLAADGTLGRDLFLRVGEGSDVLKAGDVDLHDGTLMRDDCGNFVLVGKIGQIVCKLLCAASSFSCCMGALQLADCSIAGDAADRVGAQSTAEHDGFAGRVRDACGYKGS